MSLARQQELADESIRIQSNISIDSTPETIFKILCDIKFWSIWNPLVLKSNLDSTIQPNSEFFLCTDWKKYNGKILNIEENDLIEWKLESLGIEYIQSFEIYRDQSYTKVVFSEIITWSTFSIFKKIHISRSKNFLDTWLESLKEVSESL